MNETVEDSARKVFKSYEARLDRADYVVSDVDEELLINIPFTGNVKLKGKQTETSFNSFNGFLCKEVFSYYVCQLARKGIKYERESKG